MHTDPPPNPGCPDAAWEHALVDAELVGTCAVYQAMLEQLRCIARSDAPTLIEGETGSGKEMAARLVHYAGSRRDGPFIPVNCGALPDTLIESELFGVERGAFTDARQSRRGLVSEAGGGTLFLDEVDALSAKAQVTLLRFLQDRRFRSVGHAHELRTDARVVAAANRALDALVAHGDFRADLLYRLKILYLVLPPLRERAADIELLARHFVARLAGRYGAPKRDFDAATLAWMTAHTWPGNVRELENWVHRRFLMSAGACITFDDAPMARLEPTGPKPTGLSSFRLAKAEAVECFERDYLRRALVAAGGNVSQAARLAGKERRAFGKLLKKHGIDGASLHY